MILGVNLASLRALIGVQAQGHLTEEWLPREAEALLELGASHIELLTDGLFAFSAVFDKGAIRRLAALRRRASFSVHLPYIFVDLSSLNEPVRRASRDCIRRAIEVTKPLAPTAYVIHITSPRGDYLARSSSLDQEERRLPYQMLQDQAARTLDELLPHVQARQLCVENLAESFPLDMLMSLVQRFDLSICFDVDHWAAQEGPWEDVLQPFFSRIREIHIHLQACLAPLEGHPEPVDVPRLIAYLKAADYAGTMVIEAGGQRLAIAQALGVLRALLEEQL